jgi:hypothetical protein
MCKPTNPKTVLSLYYFLTPRRATTAREFRGETSDPAGHAAERHAECRRAASHRRRRRRLGRVAPGDVAGCSHKLLERCFLPQLGGRSYPTCCFFPRGKRADGHGVFANYHLNPIAAFLPGSPLLCAAELALDDRFHETTQSLLWPSIHRTRSFRASHMIRTLEALD